MVAANAELAYNAAQISIIQRTNFIMSLPLDSDLTAAELRKLLNYDPATGVFTWRYRASLRLQVGAKAGSIGQFEYVRICIDRRSYSAHRLAWLHYYGEWPDRTIDHKNGNKADNRITNLRLATHAQNLWNIPGYAEHGLKGVSFDASHKKWVARIMKHGRRQTIGRFDTAQLAARAYAKAALSLHGEFARF